MFDAFPIVKFVLMTGNKNGCNHNDNDDNDYGANGAQQHDDVVTTFELNVFQQKMNSRQNHVVW